MSTREDGGGAMGGGRRASRTTLLQVLRVLAVLVAGLSAMTVRVIVSGESELERSTEALTRGDARSAIVHARRSASWYAPGAPHVRVAYQRLTAIAQEAERRKQPALALFAWRSVRVSARETRWLIQPHAQQLVRADGEIARLAALEAGGGAEMQQELKLALARDESPHLPWVVALVLGLVAWLGGLVWLAARATGVAGAIDFSRARAPLAITVLGVVAWLLAVWRA